MLEKAIQSLKRNNFQVHLYKDSESACKFLLQQVKSGMTVGVGGSATLTQIGFIEKLQNKNIQFFNQYAEGITREESLEVRRQGLLTDVFFSGANAITQQGEIINMDGVGNRVAAFSFGPEKVFIVAGKNKVVSNYQQAIERIKNYAAPLNAKRLNRNTPCTVDLKCHDCTSEERICNITHVLQKQPQPGRISIVLIDQDLGL